MLAQLGSALFSGGIKLLGGLLGNSAAKKEAAKAHERQKELAELAFQQQLHLTNVQNGEVRAINAMISQHNTTIGGRTNFSALVEDAEKAGFNPLTVLRAGGGAGYSTPFMTYLSPGEIPAGPGQAQAQQANVTNAWGDAADAFLGAWKSYDPLAGERQQLELGIARAQLRNLDSDTAANNRRFAIPSWTGSGNVFSSGGFGGKAKSVFGSGLGTSPWEQGTVKVTNPWSKYITANPNMSDASAIEDRYGEWVGDTYGVFNAISDAGYTLGGAIARSKQFQQSYKAMRDAWSRGMSKTYDMSTAF